MRLALRRTENTFHDLAFTRRHVIGSHLLVLVFFNSVHSVLWCSIFCAMLQYFLRCAAVFSLRGAVQLCSIGVGAAAYCAGTS